MSTESRKVDSLSERDLERFAVWQYVNDDAAGELAIAPVKRLPVANLANRVVATKFTLANGSRIWGLIGNIDVKNPRLTEHFKTFSLLHDAKWLNLARYHDLDSEQRGPRWLAEQLRLPVDEVFPMAYDVREHVIGDVQAVVGSFTAEPRERLTRAEIIALAVP